MALDIAPLTGAQ